MGKYPLCLVKGPELIEQRRLIAAIPSDPAQIHQASVSSAWFPGVPEKVM